MTKEQWNHFLSFREDFKEHCQAWSALSNVLEPLQKEAAQKDTPDYPVENPVVYNTDLDKITPSDTIKLIIIGDNPGKNEQLTKNRRYLCGQAGKIADGFFKRLFGNHKDEQKFEKKEERKEKKKGGIFGWLKKKD